MIISTNIKHLRDPFILVDNGVYYAYGTWNTENGWDDTVWGCFKNTSGRLDGEWNIIGTPLYVRPEHALRTFGHRRYINITEVITCLPRTIPPLQITEAVPF